MALFQILLRNLLAMLLAGFFGLFLAGAVYLPVVGDYLGRVIFTLGGMSVLYGLESVYYLGQVRACPILGFATFNNESCINHDLVIPAWVIGITLYGLWLSWAYSKALGFSGNPPAQTVQREPNHAAIGIACALACGGWIALNPGAWASTVAIIRSATVSRCTSARSGDTC